MQNNEVPRREDVKQEDRWNLSGLYPSPQDWEKDLGAYREAFPRITEFKGKLGQSPQALREGLDFYFELDEKAERLGSYAHLTSAVDEGSSAARDAMMRFISAASEAAALGSFFIPEIQGIPDEKIKSYLSHEALRDYRIWLSKALRFKPHILSGAEERILAMQGETARIPSDSFTALSDVDLTFGTLSLDGREVPLTHSTYSLFLHDPRREIRRAAYFQYYERFEEHKNTLAALFSGSVRQDVVHARIRNYPSARSAALFPDQAPEAVYDNLIKAVHDGLPLLHRYYDFRRRALGLSQLAHYDVYVPVIPQVEFRHSYAEAADLVLKALAPLGEEYTAVLGRGLKEGGWVDKYENKGKHSGAFSAGSYHGEPYILINFKESELRDVFTLAHEGGHSMHSWYSVKNNPFPHYQYTIFEAETASTFNEQLLFEYMFNHAASGREKAYLLGRRIDDVVATLFRQTMFAEYEALCHARIEEGASLTVDSLRGIYRELLEKYFGSQVELPPPADLEGLRIPHFYHAFYVYKYATGLAASLALSARVLEGGGKEREDYLTFLKSGGSRFPLESLALAGVDMSRPEPVKAALDNFKGMLDRLEALDPGAAI
ncbi:MAG: oligoendopeptidase F [Spirochaetales bacterium]|nr:oligoendopeptidase F [Spirochaetales bacterium]